MYEFIKGNISELTPTYVVVETGGIGYYINISLQTYTKISGKNNVCLKLHYIVREDAQLLFGFADDEERAIFRLLLTVNGIGANTARMMLSSLSPAEMRAAIETDDINKLKGIKGIGLKTAQRIVVDLKDKISKTSAGADVFVAINNPVRSEALSAMITLGFAKIAAEKTIDLLLKKNAQMTVEDLIKQALKQM